MKLAQAIITLATIIAVTRASNESSLRNPTQHLRRMQVVETLTFDNPTHHGKLVDYCLTFKTDCGQPAADAYCKEKGHGEAADYSKVRTHSEPTLTMEEHTTCSPAHNVCDAFGYIICNVKTQTYYDPMEHDRALDGCYEWQITCGGADAADAFCQDKGHVEAADYMEIDSGEETMAIGDHSVCDPAWHKCSKFTYITCVV